MKNADLTDKLNKLGTPIIVKQSFSQKVTVSANGTKSVTMGAISVPTGYELVGIAPVLGGYGDNWSVTFSKYGSNVYAYIKNYFAQSLTNTISCNALYLKK